MNNKRKALMLFLSATACISLSSCDVTTKKYTLLNYTTADGSTEVDYTTNELLLKYLTEDSASTSELYDIIYEAMLRKYYSDESRATQLRELERTTEQMIEDYKDQAEENADSSQISYSDAWEAILDEQLSDLREDRRDEDALREKILIENMKEAIEDEFYDEFKNWNYEEYGSDALQQQFNIFWGENGYLENRKPYHVSHILVELDAEADTIYDGLISSDDATEIYNVLDPLAHGDLSFGTVAEDHSADSADNFGNLGIMDISTSYVNEFKLGIYIYDTLFNTDSDVDTYLQTNSDPFNIGDYTDFFEALGVGFIPYEAVEQLYNYRNTTLNSNGLEVNEGNESYYPRNIIFNTYFNSHNISFITKESWVENSASTLVSNARTASNGEAIYSDVDTNGMWTNGATLSDISLTGFKTISFNTYDASGTKSTVQKDVLCDEKGNPILVVRAGSDDYQGIHFIVVERSGIDNSKTYGDDSNNTSTLYEYFAAETPISVSGSGVGLNEDAPTYIDSEGNTVAKTTYINNVVSTYEDYQSRAEDLRNTIKDFDEAYEQRIYTWLKQTTELGSTITITFSNGDTETTVDVNEKVDNYVNRVIAQVESSYTIEDDTWEEYVEYLTNQNELRSTKLIPITCAVNFSSGYGSEGDDLYRVCYYTSSAN